MHVTNCHEYVIRQRVCRCRFSLELYKQTFSNLFFLEHTTEIKDRKCWFTCVEEGERVERDFYFSNKSLGKKAESFNYRLSL